MRPLRLAVLAFGLALTVATCAPAAEFSPRSAGDGWRSVKCASAVGSRPDASDEPGFARNDFWKSDLGRHCVPLSQIVSGGPKPDGIPPLDSPQFSPRQLATWLEPQEPVIAVVEGNEARAYPLQILLWHEIANDTIAGRPIVVTFCPLCNSSLVFDRRLDGRELTFGTTGLLRLSDLVMWDRQTQSWWQQALGEGIVGEYTGRRLTRIDSQILSFEEFGRAYPDGVVLDREAARAEAKAKTGSDRRYGENPYVGYDKPSSGPIPGFWPNVEFDRRLPPKSRVAVATFVDPPIAYPIDALNRAVARNDQAGGRDFVLLYLAGVASPLDKTTTGQGTDIGQVGFFDRSVGGRTLTFRGGDGNTFTDLETGSEWTVTGVAINGPLKGSRLVAIQHENTFWFIWAVFRPDTEVRVP